MEIRALVDWDILMLLLVRTCFVSDNEDNRGVGHTGNKWIFNFYYFQCPGFICMIVTKMERKTLELSQHFLQWLLSFFVRSFHVLFQFGNVAQNFSTLITLLCSGDLSCFSFFCCAVAKFSVLWERWYCIVHSTGGAWNVFVFAMHMFHVVFQS